MIILAMWRWVAHSDATFTVVIIVLRSKMGVSNLEDTFIIM